MSNLVLWLKTYISIFGQILSYIIPAVVALLGYSIISIFLTPNYWLFLVIALSVPLVFLYIELHKIFLEYSTLTDSIISIMQKDMERHSEGLSDRAARIYPDKPMVSLKNYVNAITSIRTNGYIEFSNCQNMGLNFKEKEALMLYTETPGMFKYLTLEMQT